jgi:hypothetical protein
VHNTHFSRCFWALGNVAKYNGKTNASVWLEDYHLTYRVGGANDDLFIIQCYYPCAGMRAKRRDGATSPRHLATYTVGKR